MTRAESPYILKLFTLKSMATQIPITHASYSAILLVQSKHNLVVVGIYCLSGEISTTPIPCPSALEDPSKNRTHVSSSSSFLKRDKISSSGNLGCIR